MSVSRVTGLDHVVLHIGVKAVLWAEERTQRDARFGSDAIGDVSERVVNRGGIRHEADPCTGKHPGR